MEVVPDLRVVEDALERLGPFQSLRIQSQCQRCFTKSAMFFTIINVKKKG